MLKSGFPGTRLPFEFCIVRLGPQSSQQLAWEWSGSRALREGDWKVVWPKKGEQWELYNLAEDRCETTNLAASEPEITERLSEAWNAWAELTGIKVRSRKKR